MMKQSKPRPLDRMLLRILALQLFLPSLILILLAALLVGQRVTRDLGNQQLQQARSLAYTVDDYLEHASRILSTMAQMAETATPGELASYMQATWQEYGYFDTLYLLDENGIAVVLAPFDSRYEGLDMSHQPFFRKARAQTDVMISEPFPSLHTGQQAVYMTKALPDGGIVVGELNLGALQQAITAAGGEQYFITDRSGTLLAHPQSELVAQQVNVSNMEIVRHGLTGETTLPYATDKAFVLGSATQVERTEWVVVAQAPLVAVLAPYTQVVIPILLLVPVVWLAMIWSLKQQLMHHIVAPLARLSQGAAALAAGDFAQSAALAAIPATFAEISALATDFERMGQAILARQSALQESEEKYRTILENIEDGYYEVDIAGNFTFFNDAICRLLEYTQDELMGMNNRQYMDEETAKKVYQTFNTVYRTGEPIQAFDWEVTRKDGTKRFADISVSLIRDSAGEPIGFRGIARDVTEHKQAEEEIRQRTAQLEALRQVELEITTQLDLDALLHSIASWAIQLLAGTAGGIYLYRSDRDVLEWTVSIGLDPVPQKLFLHRGEGLSGKILETGEPLVVDDYQHWKERAATWADYPYASVVGVPVHWGEELLGVLNVVSEAPGAFSPADAKLLSLLATRAAIAIRNARLYEETHRRVEELAVLNDLAQALTARLDVNAVLDEAYQGVSRLMDATNFYIGLYDPEKDEIAIRYDVSESGEDAHITDLPADQGPAGYIIRNRTSVLLRENVTEQMAEMGVEPVGESALSWLGVPLMIGDRVLGVVAVQSYTAPRAYDEHDQDLLIAIASQTAVALENARLYEQAQQEIIERRWAEEKAFNQAAHLSALNAVVTAAAAATNLSDLLEVALDHTLTALRLEIGAIWLAGQHVVRGLPPEVSQADALVTGTAWTDVPDIIVVKDWQQMTTDELSGAPPLTTQFGIRASITVPILIEMGQTGGLSLASSAPRSWTIEEIALVEAVGRQLGTAAERLLLFQAEREQRELAEALEQAAAAVSSTLDPDKVLDRILEQVEQVVPGDAFNIMLVEDGTTRTARWRGYEHLDIQVSVSPISVGQSPTLTRLVETGEPIIIPDTTADPDWKLQEDLHWLRSYVGAPIQLGDETVGFLNVNSTQADQFGPTDARRLQALASHAATAIENARLFEETQQRVAELEVLQRTSLQLASSLDLPAVLDSIVTNALTLVRASDCHIYLYDDASETFTLGTALWEDGRRQAAVSVPRHDGLTATVVREGQPIVINDATRHPLYAAPEAQKWDLQAIASLPLKRAGRVLGALNIGFLRPHTFHQEELRVLGLLADQAAIAIENAQLYQQLRDHAEQLEQRVQERTAHIQAQYARQDAILRSASDGIIVTDAGGEIIQTNPIAQTWLTQTLSPEDAAQLRQAVRDVARQTGTEAASLKRPEAILELTGLDLELKSAPISEPGIEDTVTVVAVHDVSHLKALNRMKSRFVTNISHELRTPITTIKLYAVLMQKTPPEDERWGLYLDALAREADRQAQLVEDILQISRIDAGRLEMSPLSTPLNELADSVAASRQVMAENQGLTLEHWPMSTSGAEPGPVALVDPERMMQVLDNLVGNAIRYTPEGGKVMISTGTQEAKGRTWATVAVADTGMGIPDDELPHIFERFFRGMEPRAMQISGTGLGLAIVKEIVELHGGWLSTESEVGVGTTITVWLPLAD